MRLATSIIRASMGPWSRVRSWMEAMCSLGMTSTWVGATGRMSSKATISSSRKTSCAGISLAKILQNKQSSGIGTAYPQRSPSLQLASGRIVASAPRV